MIEAVELIETSIFPRQITALLSDADYGGFQSRLAAQLPNRERVAGLQHLQTTR